MADDLPEVGEGGPRSSTSPRQAAQTIGLLSILGAGAYVALEVLRTGLGWPVPDSVQVGIPFLAVPVLYFCRQKAPVRWGPLDRTWVLSAASYAPFAAWVIAAEPGARGYFVGLALTVVSFPAALWWAVDTYFHVGAVDFFTKRVVQAQAEAAWGPRPALLLQWGAWCGGHVVEWFWLRFILGDAGAAVFLGLAGLVTGVAFARWRNVSGLMAGHFFVNVAAAVAAVLLFL